MIDNYQVRNLVGVDPLQFRQRIEGSSPGGRRDGGYVAPEMQRAKLFASAGRTITTSVTSRLVREKRIIDPADCVDIHERFDALPKSLTANACSTLVLYRGTSLLLGDGRISMAVEEVTKYVDCCGTYETPSPRELIPGTCLSTT